MCRYVPVCRCVPVCRRMISLVYVGVLMCTMVKVCIGTYMYMYVPGVC